MCIQVIERHDACGCVYYTHAVDTCPASERKGHQVKKKEVLVGYSCNACSNSSGISESKQLQPRRGHLGPESPPWDPFLHYLLLPNFCFQGPLLGPALSRDGALALFDRALQGPSPAAGHETVAPQGLEALRRNFDKSRPRSSDDGQIRSDLRNQYEYLYGLDALPELGGMQVEAQFPRTPSSHPSHVVATEGIQDASWNQGQMLQQISVETRNHHGLPVDIETQSRPRRPQILSLLTFAARPCYILIIVGVLTIIGSLGSAIWRADVLNDFSGGFSLAQYILGVGVFVVGSISVIHSRKCKCWRTSAQYNSNESVASRI